MIDNLLGGGDDGDSGDGSVDDDMDGGLFDADEGGDDLMGGDDNLMGGDDDLMGGDDMAFDDMDDGGGATSAEMDNRIDEIENEVASLSSTVSTVKSENELISESVEDVEENIRKLLEVYEMVTRGVNPFVDESEMGNAFGSEGGTGGGNSMGLFGDDTDGGESEDAGVDDSIAAADADEFFDDDLDGEIEDGGDEFGEFEDDVDGEDGLDADVDELAEFDDDLDDDGGFDESDDFEDDFSDGEFDDADADSDGGGGKSFEELKAEYDSGNADWDDESMDDESMDAESMDDGPMDAESMDDGPMDAESIDDEPMDDTADEGDDSADDGDEGAFDSIEGAGSETVDAVEADSEPASTETAEDEGADVSATDGKPYLESLPSGYVADVVVMDWLEFLVEEAGVDGTARTIAYYEAIEWIDEPAADALLTFLNGFGGEIESDPEPRSPLTISHHNESLRFISRIVHPDLEAITFGGGSVPRPGTGVDAAKGGRKRGSTGRPKAGRFPGGNDAGPPGERYGVEPDGGCERSGIEAFNWGEDRTD